MFFSDLNSDDSYGTVVNMGLESGDGSSPHGARGSYLHGPGTPPPYLQGTPPHPPGGPPGQHEPFHHYPPDHLAAVYGPLGK